jgi:hypothetical protein
VWRGEARRAENSRYAKRFLARLFTERKIMKNDGSFYEKVSDGYVFTVSEEVAGKLRESRDYAVTFVQLGAGAQKDVSAEDVKKILANPSNRSTLEGKATQAGPNRIKIVTASTVTIDLNRPYATFWGLNEQRLQDILAGRRREVDSCGVCFGVEGFTRVPCTDPNSRICCENCS